MWVWLDHLGVVLFDAAVSTTLFLSAVMLAILMIRQPARRILIARAAILASLVMLPLAAFVPLRRLDVVNSIVQSDRFPALLLINIDQLRPGPDGFATTASAAAQRDARSAGAPAWRWVSRGLALTALIGASIGLAWLILGCAGVLWMIGQSHAPSARTLALYKNLLEDLGIGSARAAVRASARVARPVVVGLVRPTILIPAAMEESQGEPEQLRLTLLHEIVHAEQSDPWFGIMASLAQSVWFFVPQIWWLRSQLLIDQEFMADHLAAGHFGDSSSYAASLLSLAESRANQTPLPAIATAPSAHPQAGTRSQSRSPLFQRLLMLLHCPYRIEDMTPRPWSLALRLAVVSAAVVTSCFSLRWPDLATAQTQLDARYPRVPRSFKVPNLISEPLVLAPGGRSVAYVLPLVLPPAFELNVEVQAADHELPQIRIAGHPLATPTPQTNRAPNLLHQHDPKPTWHKVRLVRSADHLSLWLDDHQLPVDRAAPRTRDWLTIEPGPDRETAFRNLVVTW